MSQPSPPPKWGPTPPKSDYELYCEGLRRRNHEYMVGLGLGDAGKFMREEVEASQKAKAHTRRKNAQKQDPSLPSRRSERVAKASSVAPVKVPATNLTRDGASRQIKRRKKWFLGLPLQQPSLAVEPPLQTCPSTTKRDAIASPVKRLQSVPNSSMPLPDSFSEVVPAGCATKSDLLIGLSRALSQATAGGVIHIPSLVVSRQLFLFSGSALVVSNCKWAEGDDSVNVHTVGNSEGGKLLRVSVKLLPADLKAYQDVSQLDQDLSRSVVHCVFFNRDKNEYAYYGKIERATVVERDTGECYVEGSISLPLA